MTSSELLVQAIEKMQRDLDWRGPNGKVLGHIVLKRAHAHAIVEAFVSKIVEIARREEDHDC